MRHRKRIAAASDPTRSPAALRKLAERPELHVALISNPSTPFDVLTMILSSSTIPVPVKTSFATRSNLHTSLVETLGRDADARVRAAVAQRQDLSTQQASQLAADPDDSVTQYIAINASVPEGISRVAFERLAASPETASRCSAAAASSLISAETKSRLVRDPEPGVRNFVARREDLTVEELSRLLGDPNEIVAQSAAVNSRIFALGLADQLDLSNVRHINGLLHNKACPPALYEEAVTTLVTGLGGDPNWVKVADADYIYSSYIDRAAEGDKHLTTLVGNFCRWQTSARSEDEWWVCWSVLRKAARSGKLTPVSQEQALLAADARIPTNLPKSLPATFDSPPEEAFWIAARKLGIEVMTSLSPQVVVGQYRLDFADKRRKLGIEIDGLAYHSGQEAFQRDRERQRQLEMDGWRILRFTAQEVQRDPDICVQQAAEWMQAITRGAS